MGTTTGFALYELTGVQVGVTSGLVRTLHIARTLFDTVIYLSEILLRGHGLSYWENKSRLYRSLLLWRMGACTYRSH